MLRNLICTLCVILLSTALLCPLFVAADSKDGHITVDTVTAAEGDSVIVPIRIENNPGIMAITISITYDSTALTYEKYDRGYLTDYTVADHPDKGLVRLVNCESCDRTDNDIMIRLQFRVKENASGGLHEISISYGEGDFCQKSLNKLMPEITPGGVDIPYTEQNCPHDIYGDWTTVTEPTYKTTGIRQRECARCGHIETEKIPVLALYTIAYNLNGGTNNSANPKNYTVTTADIALKNPTRTGYTFGGWYSDSALKNKVTKITKGSSGNKTLYAKWTANQYTIKFNGNGSTSGSMKNLSATYDKAVTLTANAFSKKGYTFGGWNTKADGTGTTYKNKAGVKNLSNKSGATVTLYAKWSKTKYTVTYKLNGGTNNKSNPASYYITTATITLKNPTRKGYTFGGWYSDSKFKTKVTKITKGSTGSKTLYAKWTATKYTVTYKLNGGTNNSKNPKTYTITTATATLKNPTRKGYTFGGWYSDAKFKTKVTKITKGSTGNKTLYAKWKKK